MAGLAALGCAFFVAIFAPPADAQNTPDPTIGGTIRRDVERAIPAPALPEVSPKAGAKTPQIPKAEGETLVVSRFRFVGNTLISDAALTRAVAPYVGRPVDFDELQNAAAMASLAYRDRGYVATVSIPKQDIEDGIVTLKVSEARYGGAKLDPNSDGRIYSELILDRVDRAMRVEKAVNTNVLDRTLLLINDLPGASVQGGLAEGEAEGETQVVLQSQRRPLISGSVTIDQNGSLSTGAQRELVDLALNSPTGQGEQYTLALMKTEGTNYGRVGMSVPAGLDGVRAGFNVSYLEYNVIAGPQAMFKVDGNSSSLSGDLSYPLVRSQQANLYLSGSLTAKWFENFMFDRLSRSYESKVATIGLNANWSDSLAGGASNQASVTASFGRFGINDSPSYTGDMRTARTDGPFGKLNFGLSRTQTLVDGWVWSGSGSIQYATTNLDSSEKFFLGGASGVRAYPSSEGGGSSGELWQFELRKRFALGFELRLFRDEGRVRQTINDYSSQPTPNILHYRGKGYSVIVPLPNNVTVNFTWSRRQGDNPYPTYNGNDQDGTKVIDRIWLSATMIF